MGTASLLLAWAIGWPWVRAAGACRGLRPRWAAWLLEAVLALAVGLGSTAALFFALLWGGLSPRTAAFVADAVLALGGLLAWALRHKLGTAAEDALDPAPFKWTWLVFAVFAGALLLFLFAHAATSKANPQGDWDAWAVWNLRAKFLVSAPAWRTAVAPSMNLMHPEAPLLWPAAIARGWLYGADTGMPAVPVAAALLTSTATALLLALALAVLRAPVIGWLGGLVLLSASCFWRYSTGQYADFPLALLLLAALVAALLAERKQWAPPALALSGFLAALAGFAKNEGLLGCLLLGAAVLIMARRAGWAWFVGALPPLALSAAFHVWLAPPLALFAPAQLADWGRVARMLSAFGNMTWQLGEIPAHPVLLAVALAILLRWRMPARPLWPQLCMGAVLAVNLVYVVATPDNLAAESNAAIDRLLVQLLPSLLLVLCLALRVPEDAPQPVAARDHSAAPAHPRKPR